MKRLIPIIVFTLLQGCAVLGDAANKVGKVNDEAIKTAVFTICVGSSVGAVRRNFGTPEQSRIWTELCNSHNFEPINPPQ